MYEINLIKNNITLKIKKSNLKLLTCFSPGLNILCTYIIVYYIIQYTLYNSINYIINLYKYYIILMATCIVLNCNKLY